jgi:hypothetical protein
MVHDPTGLRLILFVIFLDHYPRTGKRERRSWTPCLFWTKVCGQGFPVASDQRGELQDQKSLATPELAQA